jgi:hypothetical protein
MRPSYSLIVLDSRRFSLDDNTRYALKYQLWPWMGSDL